MTEHTPEPTEFLPEPLAVAQRDAVATQYPAVPVPVGAPQAPPAQYGNFPPPAYAQSAPYYAPPTPARKGVPWWVWVIIGAVVLVILMVASAVGVFIAQLNHSYSPNYSGAPVEAAEASPTTVVSATATVAYEIPEEWVDANDYADFGPVTSGLLPGQSAVGIHFTGVPAADPPQLVMVLETSPEAADRGTLRDFMEGFLDGLRDSGTDFDDPVVGAYSTPNGLEGLRADFPATLSGIPTEFSAVLLAHGKRTVFVQWISYDGPVDTVAMDEFLATLRIDE